MPVFLKRLLTFLLPIILIGIAAELLLRKIPNDYAYKNNYLDQHAGNLQVLYLGSSHTFYGIDPSLSRYKGFNAAYVSQSIGFDYKILKKYLQQASQLKAVVIEFDYFTLYDKLETGIERWRQKNYSIYYHLSLPFSPSAYTEIFGIKPRINFSRFYKYYVSGKTERSCNDAGWGTLYSTGPGENLELSAATAAARHTYLSENDVAGNVQLLGNMIELCRKNNFMVMLYTSPAHKSYVQKLKEIQLANNRLALQNLQAAYPSIRYLNLMDDSSFHDDDFFNADHLNGKGAKKLTLKIDELIAASAL